MSVPDQFDAIDVARIAVDEGRYDEAVRMLEPLADAGMASAITMLAGLHSLGIGTVVDGPRAVALYERAVALGDGLAANNLGTLLLSGVAGVPIDVDRAQECFRKARLLGFPMTPNPPTWGTRGA